MVVRLRVIVAGQMVAVAAQGGLWAMVVVGPRKHVCREPGDVVAAKCLLISEACLDQGIRLMAVALACWFDLIAI